MAKKTATPRTAHPAAARSRTAARPAAAPAPAPAAAPTRAAAPAPAPARRQVLKVRATRLGFYGERRLREGDVFVLTDAAHFTDTWMEPVAPRVPEHTTSAPAALKKHHDDLIKERFVPQGTQQVSDEDATGDLNPLLT